MASGNHPASLALKAEPIEVDDLRIQYGPVVAVHDVSFAVQPGEQLTLLGPSGCGKTTTLRALAGLERPSAGTIRIGGRVVYSSADHIDIPAEKRGLSMVFQSYAIWPHMTVFDNVAYGLRVRKRPRAEIETRVRESLDLVQMGAFAARRASQLSGGQQQRVALARAVAFSPPGPAVRRTAVQSRRQAARRHAHRTARAAAPVGRHLGLCHARPGGGAGDVGPHRGDARRRHRTGWHAGRDLCPPAQRVRRGLRRIIQPGAAAGCGRTWRATG